MAPLPPLKFSPRITKHRTIEPGKIMQKARKKARDFI
jgi:hypothetical protein